MFEVENTAHGDEAACFVPDEINRVRKALGCRESIGAHSLTENLRRGGEYTEFSFDALDKRVAESDGAFFIPPKTLAKIASARGATISRGVTTPE